jgi:hypothetical protein
MFFFFFSYARDQQEKLILELFLYCLETAPQLLSVTSSNLVKFDKLHFLKFSDQDVNNSSVVGLIWDFHMEAHPCGSRSLITVNLKVVILESDTYR